jgi:hypothetical protein
MIIKAFKAKIIKALNCKFFLLPALFMVSCVGEYKRLSISDFYKGGNFAINGHYFQGSLNTNGMPNGYGVYTSAAGFSATGNFINGALADENGIVIINNVGTIKGKFVNGNIANGNISYINGLTYVGELANYMPNGEGILIDNNDNILSAKFEKGKPTGKVTYFDEKKQKTFIGNLNNNTFDGLVAEIDSRNFVKAEIYNKGVVETNKYITQQANDKLKEENNEEIKLIENKSNASLTSLISEQKVLKEKYDKDIEQSKEFRDMEALYKKYYNCHCERNCLHIQRANECISSQKRLYQGNEYEVRVKCSASEAEIMEEVKREFEFWNLLRVVCPELRKWISDKNGYEYERVSRLNALENDYRNRAQIISRNIEQMKAKRDREIAAKKEEQEREYQRKLEQKKIETQKRINAIAAEDARKHDERKKWCLSGNNLLMCGCLEFRPDKGKHMKTCGM